MSIAFPPPGLPPMTPPLSEVHSVFEQLAGVLLAMVGVAISVFGLHAMKIHGNVGSVRHCTKRRQWTGYVLVWYGLIATRI